GWADEARRRLNEVEQRKQGHDRRSDPPPADPAAFLARVLDSTADTEAYLDLAVTRWLPAAFSAESPDLNAAAALRKLAALMPQRHSAPWLADFLKVRRSRKLASAVNALANAVQDRDGHHREAEQLAIEARRAFQAVGHEPGVLRAGLEQVYALQRSQAGD